MDTEPDDDDDDDDDGQSRIMFLYQLVGGAAARSYGINVARLAGCGAGATLHALIAAVCPGPCCDWRAHSPACSSSRWRVTGAVACSVWSPHAA